MSLLATQVERLADNLSRKVTSLDPFADRKDFLSSFTSLEDKSRIITNTVNRLKAAPQPRGCTFRRHASKKHDHFILHAAMWCLNPAEKTEEYGLSVYGASMFYSRGEQSTSVGLIPPRPNSFISAHAINRIAERVPRATAKDVYQLAFDFAALACVLAAQGIRRHQEGSFRLPIGQCLAQAPLMITDDPELREYNMASPWLDVRTVVPVTDMAEKVQANACQKAIKDFDGRTPPQVEIPYIPRRTDGYTLGVATGRLLS
jgi:hypothetical protein